MNKYPTIILALLVIVGSMILGVKLLGGDLTYQSSKKQSNATNNVSNSSNQEVEEVKENLEGELENLKAQARDSGRLSDLRQIQNQLEIDYFSSNSYPDNIKGYLDASEDSIPIDYNGNTYKYYPIDSNNSGQNDGYEIGVCMENIDAIESPKSDSCSNISCSPDEGKLFCFKILE